MSLKDHWYIAAESRELRQRPLSRIVGGEKVVLFRSDPRKIVALLDRCAHRNLPLSLGRVINNRIECHYHGWRYDETGQCTHIPSLSETTRLPRIRVRSYPVVEQDSYVWVFLGDQPPESQPFRFPHCQESDWTSFRMKTAIEASVEACLENFLDCPHTVFVHKGWFRSQNTRSLRAVVRRRRDSVEVEFKGEPISDSVVSRLFFPKGRELRHTDRFIVPNISRVDYDFGPDRHFIITSQCTPIAEQATLVYTVVTYKFGRMGSLVRLLFEPLCRHIISQDVGILSKQTQQLQFFGGSKFCHVETDLLGLHIHSMRAACDKKLQADENHLSEREITIRF